MSDRIEPALAAKHWRKLRADGYDWPRAMAMLNQEFDYEIGALDWRSLSR